MNAEALDPSRTDDDARFGLVSDLMELIKARLTLLVLLTTAVGFFIPGLHYHRQYLRGLQAQGRADGEKD